MEPSSPNIRAAALVTEPQNGPAPEAATRAVRGWSALIGGCGGAMLGLGAWMTPSPHGLGTHAECLHIPPCGFYHLTGIPCPGCGCTTAVTWLAHGRLDMAFYTQPFGATVGLLAVAAVVLGAIGLLSGRWVGPKPFTLQWHLPKILWGGGLWLGLAWAYKIAMVLSGHC
jgi:hypothetical protein